MKNIWINILISLLTIPLTAFCLNAQNMQAMNERDPSSLTKTWKASDLPLNIYLYPTDGSAINMTFSDFLEGMRTL